MACLKGAIYWKTGSSKHIFFKNFYSKSSRLNNLISYIYFRSYLNYLSKDLWYENNAYKKSDLIEKTALIVSML